MPVVQLSDQDGPAAGLGMALGAVGGYLASNNQRKQAKEQRDYDRQRQGADDARKDKEAALYAQQVQSEIAERNATTARAGEEDANTKMQRGLYAQYSALFENPPKGLKGQALQQWVGQKTRQAFAAGLTDPKLSGQLAAEGQGLIAENRPSLADVEHGLPQMPAPNAKNAWTPQQVQQHFMQAAARVLSSPDLSDQQKQTYAQAYQKLAADAVAHAPKPETAEEAFARTHGYKMPTYGDLHPRARGGGGRGSADTGAGVTTAEQSVYDRAAGAMAAGNEREAYRIIDDPANGLTYKQRHEMRQDVKDQTPPKPTKPPKPDLATERGQDFDQMVQAIRAHPARHQEFVNRYAAKYKEKPDDVENLLPDDVP